MSVTCGRCGARVKDDVESCPECGFPLNAVEVSWEDEQRYEALLKGAPLPSLFGILANTFATRSFSALENCDVVSSENTVYAPLSLLYAIGMLISSSQDDVAKQMRLELRRCVGNLPITDDDLVCGFEALSSHLAANPYVTVESANSVWLNGSGDSNQISGTKAKKLLKAFDAEALFVPFGTAEATDAVCKWVGSKTHGKLEPDIQTSAGTVAMLLNTLYAKLSWVDGFDQESTGWGDFYADGTDKGDARVMHTWLSNRHCLVTDGLTRLTLPCEGGYLVDFLMPTGEAGLEDLLMDPEALEVAFAEEDNHRADIDLFLPKFDIKSDFDLVGLVESLHMDGVLKRQKSCPLVDGPFQVSNIVQGTTVTVDETGFEGAAYTAMAACSGIRDFEELETIQIAFDHPFVFRVRTDEDIPLFMGTVADPTVRDNIRFFENDENHKLRCGQGDAPHRIAAVHFSDGGYFNGCCWMDIRRNEDGGASCVVKTSFGAECDGERDSRMDAATYNRFCIKLRDLGVFKWERDYWEPVCDGEDWEIDVEDVDGATFRSSGSSGFPEDFDKVYKLFRGMGLPGEAR